MSAQSIEHKTIQGIQQEARNNTIKNSDKYMLERFYRLGDGYCRFEQGNNSFINEIIETNNCDLLNLINKVIEDGPCKTSDSISKLNQDVSIYEDTTKYTTSKDTLYSLWLSRGNIGSMDVFLDTLLTDEKVELEDNNW